MIRKKLEEKNINSDEFLGNWEAEKEYVKGNIVLYTNFLFQALTKSLNKQPDEFKRNWINLKLED